MAPRRRSFHILAPRTRSYLHSSRCRLRFCWSIPRARFSECAASHLVSRLGLRLLCRRASRRCHCWHLRLQQHQVQCSNRTGTEVSFRSHASQMTNAATPNHALQRTAPCVTAPASTAAFPPTTQRSRQPRGDKVSSRATMPKAKRGTSFNPAVSLLRN